MASNNNRNNNTINIKNRKATFDYEIIETFTCGIVLTGTEIKSIRQGKCGLTDTYCMVINGEVWVKNMYIAEYSYGSYNNHTTHRDRKLLLNRKEIIKKEWNLLTYSGPNDTCNDFPSGRLGNMASGFHFNLFDVKWYGSEFLYLCGEWSLDTDKCLEAQQYILKMTSGVYAKRCSKSKYKQYIRTDFPSFRLQWMLWCVFQKCRLNQNFAKLLMSVPDDVVIVEIVKNDPVWAAYTDENGNIVGGNAMGKILTICRRHLLNGTTPNIDIDLLNAANIHILGKRIQFKSEK